LLKPWPVGIPGAGQGGQFAAAFKLRGNVRKALAALLLALEQGVEGLLPLVAGLLGLLLQGLLGVEGLGQAREVGLLQQGLLHPRCRFPLLGLRLGGRQFGLVQFGFQLGLVLAQFGL